MALNRPRLILGLVIVWSLIFAAAASITEWVLRSRYLRIAASDRLTGGLTVPDRALGWRLQPSWGGRHSHHDFDVAYSVNANGFRGLDVRLHDPAARRLAFLGDSFTFGIGVDDDEVFTAVLNRGRQTNQRVYNFAIPGYSTDQEVLLAEQEVLATRPDTLVLMVYLANDLFDNQLTMPLQVRRAKPRFVLEGSALRLIEAPPRAGPLDRAGQPMLLDMVLGDGSGGGQLRQRLEARSHLFRMLSENVLPASSDDPAFERRFGPGLQLFWAIVERLRRGCDAHGTRCAVALLAGRSFVESPSSLSAQFQDFFRRRIASGARERGVELIDVAGEMRDRAARLDGTWFHPHEGHLNADGHRVVADILAGAPTLQADRAP